MLVVFDPGVYPLCTRQDQLERFDASILILRRSGWDHVNSTVDSNADHRFLGEVPVAVGGLLWWLGMGEPDGVADDLSSRKETQMSGFVSAGSSGWCAS